MTDLSPHLIEQARRILVDEGADSEGGWHSWRCFDKARYPAPCDCTAEVAEGVLSAVAPLIAAKALEEAADGLDLPGSSVAGWYVEEQEIGYRLAKRDTEFWLRARAAKLREAGR